VNFCNPRTQEVEAGWWRVRGQPWLYSKTLSWKKKKCLFLFNVYSKLGVHSSFFLLFICLFNNINQVTIMCHVLRLDFCFHLSSGPDVQPYGVALGKLEITVRMMFEQLSEGSGRVTLRTRAFPHESWGKSILRKETSKYKGPEIGGCLTYLRQRKNKGLLAAKKWRWIVSDEVRRVSGNVDNVAFHRPCGNFDF
jgi:hypothetical protein